ncbi:hypothetical protein HDC93_004706 [Streptomyces sp. AK010]|nr:hypothetical protein [Streptomyces sp. AK010]
MRGGWLRSSPRPQLGYPEGVGATEASEDAYTAEPFLPGRGGLPALRKAATVEACATNAVKHFKFTQAERLVPTVHRRPCCGPTTGRPRTGGWCRT